MEILVVIVIFLIGILAVVQVFPRGFRLLITTRNNSVATALGREALERLKSSPDLIPDEIVPVRYVGGNPVVDTTSNPLDLGPQGDSIGASGILSSGGAQVARDWMLASGPNHARRIIGEGHRLPTPRQVGPFGTGAAQYETYGGLLVLDHGPVATNSPLLAYGNELDRTLGAPREAAIGVAFNTVSTDNDAVRLMQADGSGTGTSLPGATTVTTPVTTAPYEYFVVDANTPDAALYLPTNALLARTYRVRMSAYVGTGASVKRYDFLSLSVRVPRIPSAAINPLVRVRLGDLLVDSTGIPGGSALYAVEPDTIRVAPQYVNLSSPSIPAAARNRWTTLDSIGVASGNYAPIDPFEMKVRDSNLGVLLFSPAAREGVVPRPGGVSEPLIARVDYDVRDWRIISEDFRVVDGNVTYPLSLQSLKVGSNSGPDGLPNCGLFTDLRSVLSDTNSYDPFPTPRDNVVVVDLTTGFEVQKYRTTDKDSDNRTRADIAGGVNLASDILFSVDKSRGSVTFNDADANVGGINVRLIPPTGDPIVVDSANRSFRVFYRARQEWAVQVLKGASQYTLLNSFPSGQDFAPDQAFVGDGSNGTVKYRIYFPASEAGNKVTIDRIAYMDRYGVQQVLEGQDFVIRRGGSNLTSYAYADLTDVAAKDDGSNSYPQFSYVYGIPVRGIKGASLSVRVLWNPESFTLGADAQANIGRVNEWGRGWRRSVTETYLRAEETR